MRPASCEQARKQMKQVGKVEEINRKGKFLLKWMAELRVVDFPINTIGQNGEFSVYSRRKDVAHDPEDSSKSSLCSAMTVHPR